MVIEYEYTDKPVTPWGRMQEMKKIVEKTGILEKISQLALPESQSNNSIPILDIIEGFWVSIRIGCFRFSHTAVVKVDEVLRQIFGWRRIPFGTTYGRFFKRFTPSMNHEFFIELYR